MQLAMITAQQVIVLFILIFAGFICVKSGAVSIEGKKSFSDLLVYFVVPCMIVNSYLTDFDADIFKNILYALGLSVMLLFIGIVVTWVLSLRIKDKNLPNYKVWLYVFQCGIYGLSTYSGTFWK